jgi:hypothetical protein
MLHVLQRITLTYLIVIVSRVSHSWSIMCITLVRRVVWIAGECRTSRGKREINVDDY